MRIFLVGFMGSGKSTVGSALARARGSEFVDLDTDIERRTGASIREIFELRGEEWFRDLEHEMLRSTEARGDVIVATGGGTFTFARNRELIRSLGTSVFLHPSFSTIVRRIGSLGKASRPLFQTQTEALALYRRRLPAYREADLVLEIAPGESPEQTAARLGLRLTETTRS